MSIVIRNIEYTIIKNLGEGGYGKVILAESKLDNKCYAIKEISIKDEMKYKIKNFQNEADILSRFNSKNIVKYYDSFKDNDKFYILMEYCDGQNLKDFINKNKEKNTLIEENVLYKIIKQICLGIKEIHEKNIIHRDIKPENIFMNEKLEIKIGDFGISKNFGSNEDYTLTNTKAGSIGYIAPEILTQGICNIKSDMYSLGCILYELFNLRNYFNDNTYHQIKKIDSDIYNYRWQSIINSLLEIDDNKRMDINKVYDILITELEKEINNKNIIIGEIYIDENNINKDIQIINSFENIKKLYYKWREKEDDYKYENEKELKENTMIKINEKVIEFTYYYKFKEKGKYKIEYSFKNNLTKADYIFDSCLSLTNLDFSNFNSAKVTNMSYMFHDCKSLTSLNLLNFNTENVTDMNHMFCDCSSLTNLDLSNFNTQKVIDMTSMFWGCKSLINLNLSSFDNKNVNNVSGMFYDCKSLTNLNLLNFNTQNFTNIGGMFYNCNSLKKCNVTTKDDKILYQFDN